MWSCFVAVRHGMLLSSCLRNILVDPDSGRRQNVRDLWLCVATFDCVCWCLSRPAIHIDSHRPPREPGTTAPFLPCPSPAVTTASWWHNLASQNYELTPCCNRHVGGLKCDRCVKCCPSALQTEILGSSETLLLRYQITRRHIPPFHWFLKSE